MRAAPAVALALALAGGASAAGPERVTGFVDVPQGRLWYDAQGEGPPLVLLHDGLLPSETWGLVVPALARHYRVVRYDRRFYGRSRSDTRDYSSVDDLRRLLEQLDLPPAALVGCSAGGGLALDFALDQPQRVAALVLVGPVVSGLGASEHFRERNLRNLAPTYFGRSQGEAVERWVADRFLTDGRNAAARARLAELLARYPFAAGGGDVGGRPASPPAAGRLDQVRVPVLLVTGESDVPEVQAHVGALAAGLPQAERQVIAVAGHLPQLERPDELAARVLDFLAPPTHVRALLDDLRAEPGDAAALAYAPRARLEVQQADGQRRARALVYDLSYASPRGGRVPAWLVTPSPQPPSSARPARPAAPGAAPSPRPSPPPPGPGLLFLHHGQGDRDTFLDEAVELAADGFVSLLVSAPEKRTGQREGEHPFDAAHDRAEVEQTVTDLRRGLDLLAGRAEVDPERLAFVGYSLGATMGARLLGVEPRLKASVQVAGLPALTLALEHGRRRPATSFHGLLEEPAARGAYLAALAPLDGVRFLGRRAAAPLLLQFARSDDYVSPLDAALYEMAAGPPVEVSWHDGGHLSLGAGGAREERRVFLRRVLLPAPRERAEAP